MVNSATAVQMGVSLALIASVASAQMVVESTTGDVPIPDDAEMFVGLDLDVGGNGTIEDLDVDVLVSTTFQGDIIAQVVSPAGTTVTIINRPGSPQTTAGFSSNNFGNPVTGEFMRFDDEAGQVYDLPEVAAPGMVDPTGSWIPDSGSLSDFDGEEVNGTWRLEASDSAFFDFASIQGFGISATVPEPATMALLGFGGLVALRRRR